MPIIRATTPKTVLAQIATLAQAGIALHFTDSALNITPSAKLDAPQMKSFSKQSIPPLMSSNEYIRTLNTTVPSF